MSMSVKQLIEELSKWPGDLPVCVLENDVPLMVTEVAKDVVPNNEDGILDLCLVVKTQDSDVRVYADAEWTLDDLRRHVPDEWTDEQCHEWLRDNEDDIRDEMISKGWEVIENLLREDGVIVNEDEEDSVEE